MGFDVAEPEPDLVGFSIECKLPGTDNYEPLLNRIAFSYGSVDSTMDGSRKFDSRVAPFQKFRWIHFPRNPVDGKYQYRVAKVHMKKNESIVRGTALELDLPILQETYGGYLDVGFTRNFASSQSYNEMFDGRQDILPGEGESGLKFEKPDIRNHSGESVYSWLGFEAGQHIFGFLETALADRSTRLEVMAYDLNEPQILELLEKFGPRLRVIIDDSTSTKKGVTVGHGTRNSDESKAAQRLKASVGAANVKRMSFDNLQHNKVFILRRNGVAEKVLCGSTNFTFRGLYIQANNVLVFHNLDIAGLFGKMFELAFNQPDTFKTDVFSQRWHSVSVAGRPSVRLCFSPHAKTDLSLNPVAGAIDQATSSVLYSVAFLNLMKSGPTFDAFGRLSGRPIFSYGTVDQAGGLEVRKPDGTSGLVDFAYLSKRAPEPFKSEWSGGKGRNVHHKFVVTDFNLPTARVFTGSSNLSPSGEAKNGDHLIMIEDQRVAAAYAIEGVRVFDHLEFRVKMKDADEQAAKLKKVGKKIPDRPTPISLKKPTALSGKPAWFEKFYVQDSQLEQDRQVFSS